MNLDGITVGQTFSHYRLLSKLGEGGMGIVFVAEDTRLRRQVAIKFLNAGRDGRMSRARFLREARAASVLNHPNIATVYEYGETDEGLPFIVMELLRGQTLSDLLDAGALPVERSVAIIRGVLEALAEAHRHGIVHRDVKPSNIVLGERGLIKV
ncbi:MAG: serine/threonine-protein kinase, partial [Pyrinomonadaceae bacterium]